MSIKHKHTKIRLTLLLLLAIAAMQPQRVKAQMSSNVNHINVSAGSTLSERTRCNSLI